MLVHIFMLKTSEKMYKYVFNFIHWKHVPMLLTSYLEEKTISLNSMNDQELLKKHFNRCFRKVLVNLIVFNFLYNVANHSVFINNLGCAICILLRKYLEIPILAANFLHACRKHFDRWRVRKPRWYIWLLLKLKFRGINVKKSAQLSLCSAWLSWSTDINLV